MTERDTPFSRSPSLAGARQRKAIAAGWLRSLGAAAIAVVVVVSLGEHPSPALRGIGLVVVVASVVLVAAVVALVRRGSPTERPLLPFVAIILASSALVWVQPGGAGQAGLFLAVSFAAMRIPGPRSLTTLALAVATFAVAAIHANRSLGAIVGFELGIVAFYVIATFARRAQEAHAQSERLLVALETSRSAQAEAAALRERSRLAREMHDVLAHSLSGLMLQLEGARMLAAGGDADGQLPAVLDRAHHLARAGLEEARRAIGALRDEDLPGPDRLERLAADFECDSSVKTSVEIVGSPRRLDSETSLTLYRVAQEALTNARKHGRPERVDLRLSYKPEGTRLVVQDHAERDASNLDRIAGDGNGYGLTGMRERAALLGGQLQATPTSDGFRVELWVPA